STRSTLFPYTTLFRSSEMRFPEKHQNCGVRMRLTDFPNFVSSMPIPHADLTQVFTRHTIEPIDGFRMLARSDQQFVKWRPIIARSEEHTSELQSRENL